MKRAFRQSLVLHAALYFLLIVASGLVMASTLVSPLPCRRTGFMLISSTCCAAPPGLPLRLTVANPLTLFIPRRQAAK